MLQKPILSLCNDRTIRAKTHFNAGEPSDWFSESILSSMGLISVSFDFFIDWSTRSHTVSNETWIKRVVKAQVQPWPQFHLPTLQQAIEQIDQRVALQILGSLGLKFGLSMRCHLFKESLDWAHNPSPIVTCDIDNSGSLINPSLTSLPTLMKKIQSLSGGPIRVGSKGLIYGTTTLECYLSRTDALWPGDVDSILVDNKFVIKAILEFKKHTLDNPIESQQLSNYYPYLDGRKYDRLVLLRNHLGSEIPIIIIYYPTKEHLKVVKLELINGREGDLQTIRSSIQPLPKKDDYRAHNELLKAIFALVKP